jgi:hypothetical protein
LGHNRIEPSRPSVVRHRARPTFPASSRSSCSRLRIGANGAEGRHWEDDQGRAGDPTAKPARMPRGLGLAFNHSTTPRVRVRARSYSCREEAGGRPIETDFGRPPCAFRHCGTPPRFLGSPSTDDYPTPTRSWLTPIAGETLRQGTIARALPPNCCGLPQLSLLAQGKVILAASTFRR